MVSMLNVVCVIVTVGCETVTVTVAVGPPSSEFPGSNDVVELVPGVVLRTPVYVLLIPGG